VAGHFRRVESREGKATEQAGARRAGQGRGGRRAGPTRRVGESVVAGDEPGSPSRCAEQGRPVAAAAAVHGAGEAGDSGVMSTHAFALVDSVGPPSAEVCRAASSFP
jgi:hypothetical protein